MKRSLLLLTLGLLALAAFGGSGVQAGTGIVSIDAVTPLINQNPGQDTVQAGQTLRFVLRYNNVGTDGVGEKCDVANGWKITSFDDAIWDSVVLDTAGVVDALQQNKFMLLFDVTGQVIGGYTHGNIIGFLGAGTPSRATRQLPTTWNDTSLAIWVYFHDATSAGKHVCIDSSFFGTGGVWKWVGVSLTDYFPTWVGMPGQVHKPDSGGYCFKIAGGNAVADRKADNLPKDFALDQNYPNPFNPSTVINFDVPTRSRVTLNIYNVLGQMVKTLVNEDLAPNKYSRTWDGTTNGGSRVASGIYFYKMEAGSFVSTKKMVMLK